MDRREWGEIVGDRGEIDDDLLWALFQSLRSMETMRREENEGTRSRNQEVFENNQHRAASAKVALAALWVRADRIDYR